MNSLCIHCLGERPHANYCPSCGRHLGVANPDAPALTDLGSFEARVSAFLPRLSEMHAWLSGCHRDAAKSRDAPALDLVQKRLPFLLRVERRPEVTRAEDAGRPRRRRGIVACSRETGGVCARRADVAGPIPLHQ